MNKGVRYIYRPCGMGFQPMSSFEICENLCQSVVKSSYASEGSL
jgi:hypothetical protein